MFRRQMPAQCGADAARSGCRAAHLHLHLQHLTAFQPALLVFPPPPASRAAIGAGEIGRLA